MTSIGDYAFYGTGWYNAQPNGIIYLDDWLINYKGTEPTGNVTIKSGTRGIADDVFASCYDLTSVTIPNSVTSIGNFAFYYCSGLTSVTIPESVTSIGKSAFSRCSGLTSITIPESVTSIGGSAFYGTGWYNAQPDGILYLDDWLIGCKGSKPTGNVTINSGTRGIAGNAFYECSFLTSVTIPNSVTSIGGSAFYGCSGLTSVKSEIEEPFAFGENAFNGIYNSCILTVPSGKRDAYIAAGWTEDVFKGGVVEVAEEEVSIGSLGYATYCSTHDLDFSEVTDIKAYIASGFSPSTGRLVLTRVDEVPAGEGLYLVDEEGTYEVPFTTTDMMYSNLLKGVTTATTIYPTEGSYTNFILANGIHGIGFYTLSTSGELAAGKAYLQLPTASVSNVKAISVIFDDDDPTALQDIEGYIKAENIYNLQGQKVNAPRNGLYIINGKKVLFK